jgi:hypothetical protein
MPSPPRVLSTGKLHMVSSRVEEGLPFVCTLYMKLNGIGGDLQNTPVGLGSAVY